MNKDYGEIKVPKEIIKKTEERIQGTESKGEVKGVWDMN